MRRLIINGDDFGLATSVCSGIVTAMKYGVVTSTTVMACSDNLAELMRDWAPKVSGSLGVHLQLNAGRPCSSAAEVPSLVEDNEFPRSVPQIEHLKLDEVEREWTAQIETVTKLAGHVTHLDSHHGLHRHPRLIGIYCGLAKKYNLAARGGDQNVVQRLRDDGIRTTDYCENRWSKGELTEDRFIDLIANAFSSIGNVGTVELVTHPANADSHLANVTSYNTQRAEELRILTEETTRRRLVDLGIELITFQDIRAMTMRKG